MKPYPKYKDSGVEWLGKVPIDYTHTRLKFLGSVYGGLSGKAGKDFNQEEHEDNKVFIPFTNIANNHYIKDDDFGTVTVSESESQNKVQVGDLFFLMSSEGYEDLGKSSLLEFELEEAYLNSFCKGFRIEKNRINPKYLNYLLSGDTYRQLLYTYGNGFTRINLRLEKLQGLPLLIANSVQEQTTIANFLDRETTRIDSLIKEKENFISLLKEKHLVLINHVITKGLDSTAKMKDSGVDWIGETPKHWNIKKVKHIFEIRKRISGEEGYPVLSITQQGIKVKDTITGKGQLSMDYSKYQFVEVGDFAMNHMDLLTGYVDLSKFHGVTSPDYRVFSLIDSESVDRYYLYLMQIGYKNKIFFGLGQGVANIGRWRLQTDSFNNFNIPYPDKTEQQKIVDYLDDQIIKINGLVKETRSSIELLKEHCTALISAAVTGKIDVRNKEVA